MHIKGTCPNKNCPSNKVTTPLPVEVEVEEGDIANEKQYFNVRPHRCPKCHILSKGWKKYQSSGGIF